jgi:hypothetical protein
VGYPTNLEALRSIFQDRKTHLAIGKVTKLELAEDRSVLWAYCNILSQERTAIARVTWDSVGTNAGIFQFPQVDDLVLVAWGEGDEEQAFVIKSFSSKVDTIPPQATDGDTVIRALAGQMVHLLSDSKVLLGRGATDPSENLVLGLIFKTLMSEVLAELKSMADTLAAHTHIGNMGFPTAPPVQAAAITAHGTVFNAKKANPVDNGNILSDVAFTQK